MNDLEAVRRLAAEPTDESVTRTWYQMTKLQAKKSLKPKGRLVPAVAGLAVVLVAAASLVVYRTNGGGALFPVASTPDAISALSSMAEMAGAGVPVTVPTGHLIRSDTTGLGGSCGTKECKLRPQSRQSWYDPFTGRTVKLMDGDIDLLAGSGAEPDSNVSYAPIGVRRPTVHWLASLPTDPEELLSRLRTEVGQSDSWSVDHQLWDAMGTLYSEFEIVLQPAQRAAFLKALSGVIGLTVRDLYVNRVPIVAIRYTENDHGAEILFDPTTGRAVGRATAYLGDDITIVQAGGPVLASRILAQTTWKQSITTL